MRIGRSMYTSLSLRRPSRAFDGIRTLQSKERPKSIDHFASTDDARFSSIRAWISWFFLLPHVIYLKRPDPGEYFVGYAFHPYEPQDESLRAAIPAARWMAYTPPHHAIEQARMSRLPFGSPPAMKAGTRLFISSSSENSPGAAMQAASRVDACSTRRKITTETDAEQSNPPCVHLTTRDRKVNYGPDNGFPIRTKYHAMFDDR